MEQLSQSNSQLSLAPHRTSIGFDSAPLEHHKAKKAREYCGEYYKILDNHLKSTTVVRKDESLASLQVPYKTKDKDPQSFNEDTVEEFKLSKGDLLHASNYKYNFVKQNALIARNMAEQNMMSI